jgi:hypothetical protein
MTEEVRQKIIQWIFDNHQHHDYAGGNRYLDCPDADQPYVNSIELEKFIKEL